MSAQSGFEMLSTAGLVMQGVLATADLPDWATQPLREVDIELGRYRTLVMLGQGGTRLWEYISMAGSTGANPFDDVSRELAKEFAVDHIAARQWQIVYPGSALLPLGRLAELVGWGRPSPLGLTINDEYGLWLAHRVVMLVDVELAPLTRQPSSHPCDSCATKPCIAACPVGAVHAVSAFDVMKCSTFRIGEDSPCAHQCLARSACPIGVEHRYGRAQMTHHYSAGLASIRRYLDPS